MTKTSAMSKNKWNSKAYDRLAVFVPKGRKKDIEEHAQTRGKSVNSLVNDLVRQDMGIPEDRWKKVDEAE